MSKFLSICAALFLPLPLFAHEVYVLPKEMIEDAMSGTSPDPMLAFFGNEHQFFFWAIVSIVVFSTVLFASVFRLFESWSSPKSASLKRLAHPVVRVVAGACLILYGATSNFYGPELPLASVFGQMESLFQWVFIVLGACMVLGLQTRIAALCALGIYGAGWWVHGAYMLTYLHQAGAYMLLIIIGGGPLTIDHHFRLGWAFRKHLERASILAFPILRITFGASILFASVYGKYMHSNLALAVVQTFELQQFFPFDPLFVVLGALIIESLAGLMLILGVEIRWTALFLVFWLTLAHLYFTEAWWVHVPLYGYGLAILFHGYDRFTLLGRFFKKRAIEPML